MKAVVAFLSCLAFSGAAFAQKAPTPVQFKPGATFTVLKGAVKGYDTASYSLEAKNGQVMHMLFKPSNRFCYFSVGEKGKDGFVHDGTMDGNEFGRNLTADGSFRIDVFLMRNAARRKESCRYQLSGEITGAAGGASAGVSDQMMRDLCKGATAPMYGVEPRNVTASGPIKAAKGGGFTLDGTIDKGKEGVKKMRCIFKADRKLADVMAMTPDGE